VSDRQPDPETLSQPSIAEELAAIPYEPLLPVEKLLIASSLILGASLLAILLWASAAFFPIAVSSEPESSMPASRP
jgi:hypothetical protein